MEKTKDITFVIKCFGEDVIIKPKLELYQVNDCMGADAYGICVQLFCQDDENWVPFATVTKSFGEFIGVKNAAYIDINNCPFTEQLIELGLAEKTGFDKQSGFCTYPLYVFDESFLKNAGKDNYKKYCERFDATVSF